MLLILAAYLDGTCPEPASPDNGVYQGEDFTFGNSVSYFCDPEYSIHGSSSRVCLECGKWSGYTPFCETADYSSSFWLGNAGRPEPNRPGDRQEPEGSGLGHGGRP